MHFFILSPVSRFYNYFFYIAASLFSFIFVEFLLDSSNLYTLALM